MANVIKPKRSNTAAKVPNTSELLSGELGVNMADRKVYINNGTSVVQVGAGTLSALGGVVLTSPTNGQTLSYNGTNWVNAAAGAGTVTSVTGTSPIASSGGSTPAISLSANYGDTLNPYASKTANTFLAAPNGAAGVPTFRAVVAADVPTLNQNTTGNAATATTTPKLQVQDLRSTALTPAYFGMGLNAAFMANSTDGLSDGGTYHGIMQVQQWSDASGGGSAELGFTDNNNIWHRGSSGALTSWSTWYKFLDSGNYNSYAPTLTGTGASGSWGISVTGSSASCTGNAANVTGTVAIANGGTGATTNTAARTNLGATTVGSNFFTLTNPGAVTFPRMNADNTVSSLDAATFRTAIGAGTSSTTGTVTSVAALTLGTTGTDLSSTVANGTTTPVITLQVPTASATNRGALSSADWTTFNNKQAALGFTPYNATNPSNYIALASAITGYTVGANTALAATDTLLAGLGKIQGQINARGTGNGTVTSVATGTGLSGGTITTTGTISLANTAVTAGSYTNTNLTVDAQGRITAASNGTSGGVSSITGTANQITASASTGAVTLSTPSTFIAPGSIAATTTVTGTTINATQPFIVNSRTASVSYSIPVGSSAMCAGPITINSGVVITVPTGAKWVVL